MTEPIVLDFSQNALTPCILHLSLGRSGLCGVNFEALRPRPAGRFREQARRCPNRLRLRAHARLAAWRRGSVVLVPLFAQLGGRDRSDSTVFGGADVAVSVPPQQRARAQRANGERTRIVFVLRLGGRACRVRVPPRSVCRQTHAWEADQPGADAGRVPPNRRLTSDPRTHGSWKDSLNVNQGRVEHCRRNAPDWLTMMSQPGDCSSARGDDVA